MKINLDCKLNFGDTIFIPELVTVDELGEIVSSNPVIRAEKVKRIILNDDHSIDYNETGWFSSLKSAKQYCEDEMFETQLSSMYDKDQVNFVWREEPYIQENDDDVSVKYILEAELPEMDKNGNIFID